MNRDLQLYSYYRSSASYRARIALNLKGLEYKLIPVHLLSGGGEQHKLEYTNFNPMQQVPALLHGDKVIAQTMAILVYLDDAFEGAPLFPQEAYKKAKCLQICETINSGIQPLQNLSVLQYLEKNFGFSADQKKTWIQKWVLKGYTALERLLEDSSCPYCLGDQPTAADAFLIPQIFSGKRFGAEISDFPTLQRIYETCLGLPAFVKAAPENQPDFPKETA